MEFCPICYEHMRRDSDYERGDILICGGCELPLVVTSVHPLVFDPLEPVYAASHQCYS
jgi:hypothetical protein